MGRIDNPVMQFRSMGWAGMGLVACLMVACSPTLDWRDVRLGPDTRLQFPCKPDRLERKLPLLDRQAAAQMLVCDGGGLTWSATVFDLGDPTLAPAALRELHERLLANLQGSEETSERVAVPGMTVGTQAQRSRMRGTRPDGSTTVVQALFVARGPRVYQLVVMARPEAPEHWSAQAGEFLDALSWRN
jgi:hypothetical protein